MAVIDYVNSNIKTALSGGYWRMCPWCGAYFGYVNIAYEINFRKTEKPKVYIHENCGNLVYVE